MANLAVTQETICALRRKIARIEGVLPESLATPVEGAGDETIILRHGGSANKTHANDRTFIESGAAAFDTALDGGLPKAALTEIIGAQSRDAAATAGFALALAARTQRPDSKEAARKDRQEDGLLCLWIGLHVMYGEVGFPYAPGLQQVFGLSACDILFAQAARLDDILWIAEEAAGFAGFSALILELGGNPSRLDLTATRRLHRRAARAGRPVFLLRQGARAEPTAAPVRLLVSPAPSALRHTLAGLLPQSIGPPAFSVTIDKNRGRPAASFHLEWNRHDLAFQESRAEDTRALVPASAGRPGAARPARAVLALPRGNAG